jgi:hypothetical protein
MRNQQGGLPVLVLLASFGCSGAKTDVPAVRHDSSSSITVPAGRHDTPAAPEWQIIPGRSVGFLTPTTSQADLQRRYGKESVTPTRVELGEGETTPGTVLFPSDSARRLEIVWQDTVTLKRPARVILRGNRSEWKIEPGISLGTSLQELERLNNRPFTLAGFGWDYAGVITDWKGGALDSALAGIKLYVDPGPAQYESAAYSKVLGDRDYSSSLPPMQQLNPRVGQIFVDFE